MGEKKGTSISLGTAIYLFIILLLVVALGIVYYLGFVERNQEIAALKDEVNKLQNSSNINQNNKAETKEVTKNNTEMDKTTDKFEIGNYKIQPDRNLLDSGYFEMADYGDEMISFLDNGRFEAYLGWGNRISGNYEVTDDTINCIIVKYDGEYSPEQDTKGKIVFKIIDSKTLEIIEASESCKVRSTEMTDKGWAVIIEEKDQMLYPFIKGIKFMNSSSYEKLTNNLSKNEMFGLINISKNTDGTYTLYGGIYEKINSTSAKLSTEGYRKVVVAEDTKYIDHYGKETTIKGIYNDNNFPREDNELSSTIYANSTWLLRFEFSQSKCTLIEEINLAT